MHEEASRSVAERSDDSIDQAILMVLLGEQVQPWAVDELVREIGDRTDVEDSISRLYRAGLVHRLETFVFPSRAARRTVALTE